MKKDTVRMVLWCLAAVFGLFAAVWPASARAADLTAATTAELITVINTANGNSEADTITLTAGATYTITDVGDIGATLGNSGLPQITSEVTIQGNGAVIQREASNATKFRILRVGDGGTLTLSNATIRGGYADGNCGGGILVNSATAVLSMRNVTISDSTATGGGGLCNRRGTVTIRDSTISGNTSDATAGGGVFGSTNTGTTTIKNSTISGNTCNICGGGGIANLLGTTVNITAATISGNTATNGSGIFTGGTLSIRNSIVSENTGGNCATDAVTITSNGYNIENGTSCGFNSTGDLNADPLLATAGLADNGGTTKTIALQSTSPAIDAGDSATCAADTDLATDQRGAARKGTCDIGAYEFACGNSTTDPGEQCDDGNAVDDDRCSNSCTGGTSCGDGVIQTNFGEECDNGASNSDTEANACRSTCRNPSCGDSVIDEGQSCDDGNTTDGDGCSAVCASESAEPAASSGGCGLTAADNNTFNFALLGIMAFISVTAIFVSRRLSRRA